MATHTNTPTSQVLLPETAVRSWNPKHTDALVRVDLVDGVALTAGGKRAARAQAVIVAHWPGQPIKLYGLRADLSKAQVEAERLATQTQTRPGRKHLALKVTPALWAVALPIAEAQPAPAAPSRARQKARQELDKLIAETQAQPAPAAEDQAPRAPRPNAERRNETTHPDGAAAVAATGCPSCKARKGTQCTARSGERTNHVHAGRMRKWEGQ
jgi:hypothetical protein